MIYYVLAKGTKQVKIGYTRDRYSLSGRISSLQTGCPHELELLAVQPGTQADEADLHEEFKSFRGRGEWFELGKELKMHIYQRQAFADREKFFRLIEIALKRSFNKAIKHTGYIVFGQNCLKINSKLNIYFIDDYINITKENEFVKDAFLLLYHSSNGGEEWQKVQKGVKAVFLRVVESINPFLQRQTVSFKDLKTETYFSGVVYGNVEKMISNTKQSHPHLKLITNGDHPPAFALNDDEILNAELAISSHMKAIKEFKEHELRGWKDDKNV